MTTSQERTLPTFTARLSKALKTIWQRISRPKRNAGIIVWSEGISLLAAVSCALTVFLSNFDLPILQAVRGSELVFFQFLAVVTDAAKSHYYLIPALIIMTLASLSDWTNRAHRRVGLLLRAYERAAFIFVVIAGSGILINIIKQFVGRGRPRTLEEFGPYVFSPFEFNHLFQSFPSGHSATAGALGMIIGLYFPALRGAALIVFAFLAFARVAAGAHYPSDVVAGYAFGAIFTLIIARWLASRAVMFRCASHSMFPVLRA